MAVNCRAGIGVVCAAVFRQTELRLAEKEAD